MDTGKTIKFLAVEKIIVHTTKKACNMYKMGDLIRLNKSKSADIHGICGFTPAKIT